MPFLKCPVVQGLLPSCVLACGLIGATPQPLAAQQPPAFERYSIDRGLSQSTVRAVLQDQAGFIWLATHDGLNRFDGYTFTVFRHDDADSSSLSHNFTYALAEETNGVLWVGTGHGLSRFDTRTGRATTYLFPAQDSDPNDNVILSVLRDRSGRLWVGTPNGLALLDTAAKQLQPQRAPPLRPRVSVVTLHEDRDGMLWLGTFRAGLVRFDPRDGSAKSYRLGPVGPPSLLPPADAVRAIYEGPDGQLWIGTNSGLATFDRVSERFTTHPLIFDAGLKRPAVTAVVGDSTAALWIGTEGSGLYRLDPRTGASTQFSTSESNPASLGTNTVYALRIERGGALWIGLVGGGANRLDLGTRRFGLLSATKNGVPGLSNRFVQVLHVDREGIAWIGTLGGGLNRFDRRTGEVRVVTPRLSAADNEALLSVRGIAEDPSGFLWITAAYGGIYRFDRRTERFTRFVPPPCAAITCRIPSIALLRVDRRNRVWFAGNLIAAHLDSARQSAVSFPIAGISNVVFEDRHGTIWLGTRGGLSRIDNGTAPLVQYEYRPGDPTSLSHNDVRSIIEDREGTLWIGTAMGLNAFDRRTGTFRQVRRRDGLVDEFIYGILQDAVGDLWLSTNSGLTRYTPGTGRIRNYDTRDGLQSNEFNTGVAAADSQGVFYFGGIDGLNFFDPLTIHDNPIRPHVEITGFKRFNKPEALWQLLDARGRLVLPARDNLISFEFSALTYRMPERNRYAYRLDGFDREWIDIGAKREATYTSLDPGNYTLRIKAANNDGVWNEGVALPIVVTPPWWQTLWFRALAVGLIVGSTIVGVRLRFRTIQRRNQLLETLVEERTAVVRRQELALREASRRAGMADVATGVLHNIGNVFNGVNVSASVIERSVKRSKAPDVVRAGALLREQAADLAGFLASERGRQLPVFIERVGEHLVRERDGVLTELASLTDSISHAARIITAQQALAGAGGVMEALDLAAVVKETVEINTTFWDRDGITVALQFGEVPPVTTDRHQFIQVLVNLLLNARQAVLTGAPNDRRVMVDIATVPGMANRVRVQVIDNGVGIAPEQLVSIFVYGLATKSNGHGFGLHNSANAMRQVGGTLRAESNGLGRGATFTIELPIAAEPLPMQEG
ncbi:MAG: hypothetical protein HOP28_05285 [Gemmatimonadales bacterium]|nr:hypothetical protein [Gemmatimonadales bacterium]